MKHTPAAYLALRQELELTQEKMGALVGVSFTTINRWERGHSTPQRAHLDIYDALTASLRRGKKAATILKAAELARPQFLRKLFIMAHAPGGER